MLSLDGEFAEEMAQQDMGVLVMLVAGFFLLLLLLGIASVFLTHRMAGPIHGFKNELHRIEEGHAPRPIGVRQGDEFEDVAGVSPLNFMVT